MGWRKKSSSSSYSFAVNEIVRRMTVPLEQSDHLLVRAMQDDKVDIWGRRRLSFEINKKAEGIYAVLDLTCSPAAVLELDRQLNLNEAVLRTKVMRPEAH